jgi:hypothetical protein
MYQVTIGGRRLAPLSEQLQYRGRLQAQASIARGDQSGDRRKMLMQNCTNDQSVKVLIGAQVDRSGPQVEHGGPGNEYYVGV